MSVFTIENFLIFLLIFEGCIIIIMTIFLVGIRVCEYYEKGWEQLAKQHISLAILEQMEKISKAPLEIILKPYAGTDILLYQVESFDRRFTGGDWEEVKSTILRHLLLPKARRLYKKLSWIKRNFAARCFALEPFPIDEKKILTLNEDPVFLVRAIAASAVIKLSIEKGVFKIIEYMSRQQGYSHYFYQDLIVNEGKAPVFDLIEQIANSNKDPAIQEACLNVLAGKSSRIDKPFLFEDLNSENESVRLGAVKVFAHNLQVESPQVLLKSMDDKNPQIRAQAAMGLSHFLSEETLEKLERALSDAEWIVRLQAALSLKKMGKLGMTILNKQTPEVSQKAYDTAQYALQFDW